MGRCGFLILFLFSAPLLSSLGVEDMSTYILFMDITKGEKDRW